MRASSTSSAGLLLATMRGVSAGLHFQPRQLPGLPTAPDWDAITPSRELLYTECFDGLMKCARLLVPMDWSKHNTSCSGIWDDEDTVAIAITPLPAAVPRSDPTFGGTVLWNPGGPGGAAVNMGPFMADQTRWVVDGEKHFTTPAASCFAEGWQKKLWELQKQGAGVIDSSDEAFAVHYQYERAHGELCDQAGPGSIHAHLGTASVARDLLHIVDKVDEKHRRDNSPGPLRRPEAGKPNLQYFGHSYGSVLGNYFASMFPGRVGRMLVSAIVDADDYRVGTWKTSLGDSEAAIDYLYDACFERPCPLRLPSDKEPDDIKARVNALLERLDTNSTSILHEGQIHIIRSEQLRWIILSMAYNPDIQMMFDDGMYFLATILAGDLTPLITPQITADDFAVGEGQRLVPLNEVGAVIRCLDANHRSPERTLEWARDIYETMKAQSPTAAQPWVHLAHRCISSKLKPAYDFHGTFGSPAPGPDPSAAPLLVLSSRADPVTPLANAVRMTHQHGNSSLIIADVSGHQQFVRSTECLRGAVQRYFAHGVMPENGTVCAPAPYEHIEFDDAEEGDILRRRNLFDQTRSPFWL